MTLSSDYSSLIVDFGWEIKLDGIINPATKSFEICQNVLDDSMFNLLGGDSNTFKLK